MGISRTPIGLGAAAIAVLLTVQACAESASNETKAVGQTVSTAQPAKNKAQLFRHKSYPKAWTAAQQSNRPILLYVTMPGCPHCDKMMEETLGSPHVKQMVSESFETVYVSRRTNPKLVKSLKVKWYPTTVLVGSNNKVVDVIEGYVDAKTFQTRLKVGLASADPVTQTR
jgi:thioredoxin-related protein